MLGEWGNTDRHECIRIVHAALDHGINFIDTADVYGAGTSEEIVGEAIRGRRDKIVLATKAHMPMGDDVNQQGNSRRWLYTALENSLRRLGVDHVDLLQLHRLDPDTDLEETLSALTDLRQMGKVRYFGTSTFPAHELVRAQWVSERNHLGRFSTEQPPYSMITRGIEGDVLPVAQRYDLGVMTWSPLAGGWLSGAYRKDADLPRSYRADRMPWRFDMSMPDNQRKPRDCGIAFAAGGVERHEPPAHGARFRYGTSRRDQRDHRSANLRTPRLADWCPRYQAVQRRAR